MLAARYKFSPRTVVGIFNQALRSKKNGYSVLVMPKTTTGSKMAVVLTSAVATTAVRRHAIKRVIYQNLAQWVQSGKPEAMAANGISFYLIVLVVNWKLAEPQLHTQDWKETVEYLLSTQKKLRL